MLVIILSTTAYPPAYLAWRLLFRVSVVIKTAGAVACSINLVFRNIDKGHARYWKANMRP